jgi:hypothetical protein
MTLTLLPKNLRHALLALILCGLVAPGLAFEAPVDLGSAASFVVLAGSTVTINGDASSHVVGDVGVSPGEAIIGIPPVVVDGTVHAGDTVAAQAQADLAVAFDDAAGRSTAPTMVAGNIGGRTLVPGLYKSTSSLEVSSGDLTLDGQGDPDAVFIFQVASTFNTTPGRRIILVGGTRAANVFWQVGSSSTFGTTSEIQGTVMAAISITFDAGAKLTGRALAQSGAVTLDSPTVDIDPSVGVTGWTAQ